MLTCMRLYLIYIQGHLLMVGTSFTAQNTFWFYTKNKHDIAILLRALKEYIPRTNTIKSQCFTTIFNGRAHGLKILLGTKFSSLVRLNINF